jgi:hypothetical protein
MNAAISHLDRALLVSEWCAGEAGGFCPSCEGQQPVEYDRDVAANREMGLPPSPAVRRGHASTCDHDLSLAERAYPTQESRDRARALLGRSVDPTMPPPPGAQ